MYYLLTGFWPVLDRRSFERVTGPKVDFWLVKTTGALLGVIGAVLLLAGVRRRVSPEITLLGAGSSASLATSGLVYSSRGRISPIYAAEAVVEVFVAGLWLAGLVRARK